MNMNTNQELLYRILEKAEKNNTVCRSRCFVSICDYLSEDDITIYKKHYSVIFSHDFLKAFFGNGVITNWTIDLTNDIVGLNLSELFDSKKFITLFGKQSWEIIKREKIPSIGGKSCEALKECVNKNHQIEFVNCFKKEYQKLVSCHTKDGWKDYSQYMVLEENPLKYLKQFLED